MSLIVKPLLRPSHQKHCFSFQWDNEIHPCEVTGHQTSDATLTWQMFLWSVLPMKIHSHLGQRIQYIGVERQSGERQKGRASVTQWWSNNWAVQPQEGSGSSSSVQVKFLFGRWSTHSKDLSAVDKSNDIHFKIPIIAHLCSQKWMFHTPELKSTSSFFQHAVCFIFGFCTRIGL